MDLKDSEERSDREGERERERAGGGARWRESVKERQKRCRYKEMLPLLGRRVFFFFFRFIGAPAEKLIAPEC